MSVNALSLRVSRQVSYFVIIGLKYFYIFYLPYQDYSRDKDILNGSSTTRTQIDYLCTRPATTIVNSSTSSLTTTATSSTSSLNGKRLNTSTTHLLHRLVPSCQFYRLVAISLSCNKLVNFIKLQQVF